MLVTGLSGSSAALGAGSLAGFDGNPLLSPSGRMPARPRSGVFSGRFPPFSPTFPGGTRAEADFRQNHPRNALSVGWATVGRIGRGPSSLRRVGGGAFRSVRGRGLGSAPGASASSARMLGRCPKGAERGAFAKTPEFFEIRSCAMGRFRYNSHLRAQAHRIPR